eukprot:s1825_g14.t1
MADLSACKAWEAMENDDFFTLEHPGNSIALHLASWRRLIEDPRVETIKYHTCRFEGSRRKKSQVLITNGKTFKKWIGLTCSGGKVCDRTGLPHLKWRPTVSGGRVVQFKTGDEREYPVGFCERYASAAYSLIGPKGSFIELVSTSLQSPLQSLERVKATREQRQAVMVESNRQPGYGKRIQLVPDGLSDPVAHLNTAMRLDHPFRDQSTLKEDHEVTVSTVKQVPEVINKARLARLGEWRSLAVSQEISDRQKEHEQMACENARRLGRRPRTALMEHVTRQFGIEDRAVPVLCLLGMPIVGRALESPFFEPHDMPAQIYPFRNFWLRPRDAGPTASGG